MSIFQTELAKGLGFGDLSKSEVLKTCLLDMAFVMFFYGLRLDFLLCWICSFVIGVEDVHVGQSLPGSQGENSWPGLHILGIIIIIIIIAHSWHDKDKDKDLGYTFLVRHKANSSLLLPNRYLCRKLQQKSSSKLFLPSTRTSFTLRKSWSWTSVCG